MSAPMRPSAPLFFVLCPSFHGATVLSLLLNNHADVVALGDTNPPKGESTCACGHLVGDCPFWKKVSHDCRAERFAQCGTLLPTLPQIIRHQKGNQILNALLASIAIGTTPAVWHTVSGAAKEYTEVWEVFRRLAATASGARLIVDGQKSVSKFLVNRSLGGYDPHIIHLTRDPRGYAVSARRHRGRSLSEAASEWKRFHRRISWVSHSIPSHAYLRIRYEDLATHPNETLRRIFSFMKLSGEAGPYQDQAVRHVIGNQLLSNFRGDVTYDSSWLASLSSSEQASVRRQTQPLFSRFGY